MQKFLSVSFSRRGAIGESGCCPSSLRTPAVIAALFLAAAFLTSCVTKADKTAYQKAVQSDSIESYEQYLRDFAKGHYRSDVRQRLSDKIFELGEVSRSYQTLETFEREYSEFPAGEKARRLLEQYKKDYDSNAALQQGLAALEQEMRAGRLEEGFAIAESLHSRHPEISGTQDLVLPRIADALSLCLAEVRRLDTSDSPVDKLKRMTNFERLGRAALLFHRFELAKAAFVRAFLEIFPWHYTAFDIQFHKMLESYDEKYKTRPFMFLTVGLRDELLDLFDDIDRPHLASLIEELVRSRSVDMFLKNRAAAMRNKTAAEELFLKTIFETAIEKKIGTDDVAEILNSFGHPAVLEHVAGLGSDYVSYRLANLATNVGEDLRPGLLRLLDDESFAVRINALVALAWLAEDAATTSKIKAMITAEPKDEHQKVQNLAVEFFRNKSGESPSIVGLIQAAQSDDYQLMKTAVSLLRYTESRIPADKAMAVLTHVSSGRVKDPEVEKEKNLMTKSVTTLAVFEALAGVAANSEYSDELGRAIFTNASRAYDTLRSDEIRMKWRNAAETHLSAMQKLAESHLDSDDLMKSSLAVQILFQSEDRTDFQDLAQRFEAEILPAWQKRKNAYFRPFVEEEKRSELQEREKTTFYPYYIPYGEIYSNLTEAHFKSERDRARILIALKAGLSPEQKLAALEKGEMLRVVAALSAGESDPAFIGRVRSLFKRPPRSSVRLACAAVLAGRNESEGFEFLIARTADSDQADEAFAYLDMLELGDARRERIRQEMDSIRASFDGLRIEGQRKGEDDEDAKARIGRAFIPPFVRYVRFSHLLAREIAKRGA